MTDVPDDYPVRPLSPGEVSTATDPVQCGTCGRWWDDAIATSMTPAPSARCPFEYFHDDTSTEADMTRITVDTVVLVALHEIIESDSEQFLDLLDTLAAAGSNTTAPLADISYTITGLGAEPNTLAVHVTGYRDVDEDES
jgi:hypothetical protein